MKASLHVRIGRGVVSAKAVSRHCLVWAAEATFTGPDDLREVIAQLATEESLPVRLGSIRVKLEPPLAQVRTLEGLPPVKGSALRALVGQQAGRFFRKNGKPLVTDAVWVQRSRGQSGVARAAAAEEPWIEAITAGARSTGLELESIRPAGDGAAMRRLSLFSPAERLRRKRAEVLTLRRLAILAAVLWVVAGTGFAVRVQRERSHVQRELARLSQPAQAMAAARHKLAEAARMVEMITAAERERRVLFQRLAAITDALPDSAYLTSLNFDGRAGSMSGLARQAADVVAALERQAGIASPRLVGPALREISGGKERERFTLSFEWGKAP